jgi:hypothetical protein
MLLASVCVSSIGLNLQSNSYVAILVDAFISID